MRNWILKAHRYLTLVFAVLIVIQGVSGGILAFYNELDATYYGKLIFVRPEPGVKVHSLSEVSAALGKEFPGEWVYRYFIPDSPDRAYRAQLARGLVSINPYTLAVIGIQPPRDGFTDIINWIHTLHVRLFAWMAPATGRLILTYACIAMLALLLSGIYLWWPTKRARITWRGLSQMFSRRGWWEIHNTTGIFSFLFLLLLAVTGVLIGFDKQTTPLFYRLTGSAPTPPTAAPPSHPADAKPLGLDQLLEIARKTLPGAWPGQINLPNSGTLFEARCHFPEDRHADSYIRIDPYSGQVLYVQGTRTAPAGARIYSLVRNLHTGDIWGLPSRIVLSLASFMAAGLCISGIAMWWKGRRGGAGHTS